jgi:hypothetical protein
MVQVMVRTLGRAPLAIRPAVIVRDEPPGDEPDAGICLQVLGAPEDLALSGWIKNAKRRNPSFGWAENTWTPIESRGV